MKINIYQTFTIASFLLLFLCGIEVNGQSRYTYTNRVNVRIFGGLAGQNGSSYNGVFSESKSGLYGSAFLGYRFKEENKIANYFGVFGSSTKVNSASILNLQSDQAIEVPVGYTTGLSNAYELEGGFIFGDWFRISTGAGGLLIPINGGSQKLNYFTGTGGFIFGKRLMNLHTSTTVIFGGDMKRTAFRINLGIGLNFKFLKSRKKEF